MFGLFTTWLSEGQCKQLQAFCSDAGIQRLDLIHSQARNVNPSRTSAGSADWFSGKWVSGLNIAIKAPITILSR